MRRVGRGAGLAALIVLAAGHVGYWYWPRERPARLESGSVVASVLTGGDLELRVWVPYPHQNLAFLTHAQRGENWRRGLADLAGLPEVSVPSFGPFAMPPASALAVATDAEGKRLRVAAEIYPVISWVARLAGRLADNPWLAGGEVHDGGRRLEVAWVGRTWTLRTPGENWTPGSLNSAVPRLAPALARFEIDEAIGPLPPGSYQVVRQGPDLDLLTAGVDGAGLIEPAVGALIMTERQPGGFRASAVLGPGGGGLRGVPSAVAMAQHGVEKPALPFQGLYRVLGVTRRRASLAGWSLVASDRKALQTGRKLVPEVERRVAGSDLDLSYAADLEVVRAVSADLEEKLEGIPLPAIREIRQWRGASLILHELGAYDRWSLEVRQSGGEVRSRLWHAD